MHLDLALEGRDLHLELAHVLEELADAVRRSAWQLREQRRHAATYFDGSLRDHVTELGKQSAQAVDGCGALLDESLSSAMQTQVRLLLEALHWHKPHARAAHRLADGLGVIAVVLTTLAVGSDELRCHQLHPVAEPGKPTRPLVRTGTRFHPDQARRALRDQLEQLRPPHAATQHHRALHIDSVHREQFFARSLPTVVTSLMGLPLLVIEHAHAGQSWHFDAVSGRGSPLHSLGRWSDAHFERGIDVLFMVIERFRDNDMVPIYERVRDGGRFIPEGLKYIDSWVEPNFSRCFQLMECNDPRLLQEWVLNWRGMGVSFEIVPVVSSAQTREVVASRLAPSKETK